MIKVYDDEGVVKAPLKTLLYELSDWKTSTITANEIIHSDWRKDTQLLIIPGGRDLAYHTSLKGKGNQKIREFVEGGGSFLGICAGAYYGCKFVEFDKGMPLEVVGDRELSFYPGSAKGPAYGPGTFYYDSEKGAQAAPISDGFFNGSFRSYFNGGCFFEDVTAPHIKVLSRYLDIEGEPAAIVECEIGKGKAILSGVHFEIGVTDPRTTLVGKMKEPFREHEIRRRQFFTKIIDHLCPN